ncbi:similar to Saccharomyces cerevisiae YGL128C CWC23 Component of a complex containing Cef1p, putatively involved in pre-mRNA splicing [Maudiozyma saulgeensis]|uniref:Similar to Saccharomyces cerevisiae YGL128C CWC23 Component of a complex containing Cef1p, putatively involved in pre-mRNA splicing n=1 Tax=Maudiozyma saulgeensis TaxID=1789683 RepID=A0A1X7R8E3_9SACH|nr:similar to Saccharomyces cerevisiae YGL128C CWC23 Component of a complex containing Cef1p, putatively involved in pre-mRNA splicing [Kazachstania saulgeensis]
MDRRVSDVVDKNIDLYAVLGLDVAEVSNRGGTQQISTEEIRSRYKQMTLVYHPDKNVAGGDDNSSKFHEINLAMQLLTDKSMKSEYDHWYHRKFFLQKQENNPHTYKNDDLIATVQEYGEMLRKMKHFKVPFGDWSLKGKDVESQSTGNSDNGNDKESHFYDSATLRLEFDGDPIALSTILEKSQLRRFLLETTNSQIIVNDIHDIYYSSRNDVKQGTVVSYIEITTPERASSLLRSWQNNPAGFSTDNRIKLSSMAPRVPIHYYSDIDIPPTELNPQIMAVIRRQLESNATP